MYINIMVRNVFYTEHFTKFKLIQGHSGTAQETSRNAFSTSQLTNEGDSQSDPHPEAGIFHNQTTQNSGPEDGHDNNVCWLCGLIISSNPVKNHHHVTGSFLGISYLERYIRSELNVFHAINVTYLQYIALSFVHWKVI